MPRSDQLDLEDASDDAFAYFAGEGLITSVLRPLKSGKEATVHLCRADPSKGTPLVALKTYRPATQRDFRNEDRYRQGLVIGNARDRRAMRRKSEWGRTVSHGAWVGREFEVLSELHAAGADVPRPIASSGGAILMEYIGHEDHAAPQLRAEEQTPAEASETFDRLIRNVELFLRHNVVHADLSPYNVLLWEDRPVIIDFPQAVDARTNRDSASLLLRDVTGIVRHFARFGVRADADVIARDLWTRYLFAML